MTTERQPAPQELDAPADGLDQAVYPDYIGEITDNTSEEQRAIEAQALSELDGEDGPGEAPEPESEAPAAPQAISQTPPVEPSDELPAAAEPPKPRLEDSPEWRKAQASWQKQIDAERNRRLAAEKERDQFNLEAEVETRLRSQEQRFAAQYSEEDARRIARDPENVRSVRAAVEGERAAERVKQLEQQTYVSQRQQILHGFVDQSVKDLGLDAEQGEALLSLITPAALSDGDTAYQTGLAIERMAAQLSKLRNTQAAAQKERQARVPAETAATRPENGSSPGDAPESYERRLARIRQKPSWEWTDDDLKFMRS